MSASGPAAQWIGVVVPTLDEEPAIERLLRRLAAGGSRGAAGVASKATAEADFDGADAVVVADGGSLDRTRALARAGGAAVLHAPLGRGSQLAAGARFLLARRAFRRAPGDVLLFLHADTCPRPGALAAVRRAFALDAELGAIGMRQRIAADGAIYRAIERAADARVRRSGLVWGDSGLGVRARVYEGLGGFAPLPLFEDVDLARRLRRVARPRLLAEAELEVSARRWQRDGPLRRTIQNRMLYGLYLLGVPPARLVGRYPPEGGSAPGKAPRRRVAQRAGRANPP